jgi:hypothetical protein
MMRAEPPNQRTVLKQVVELPEVELGTVAERMEAWRLAWTKLVWVSILAAACPPRMESDSLVWKPVGGWEGV